MAKPTTCTTVSAAQMAEHEGLVRWVVCRQHRHGLSFEDAVHEGRIGLWRALQGYDSTRPTKFSTYAVVVISRAVWRAIANHQNHQQPTPDSPNHLLPLTIDLPDPTDELHQAQVWAELHRLVGLLPQRLRGVIVDHYGLNGSPPQTFSAIGQTLGVTRQRVQQLHLEALLWLAQPQRSLTLRALLDRAHRRDYQHVLARQRQWRTIRRARRGGKR